MDKTVPLGAAMLLDFIRKTEVGRADRASYDVIFGHNQDKLPKPVTSMTLAEIQKAQASWTKRFGSSATGGYQFMRKTLGDLIKELKLSGTQRLDPGLQDRLGYHLLKRRGYEQFMAGKISRNEFGKRLAMEWASFPVLAATKGQHRNVKRGQSFYAGDGLNKALVSPAAIEALLDRVKSGAPAATGASARIYTAKTIVEVVQRRLKELGYPVGDVDGKIGTLTREQLLAFRAENGLSAEPVIDDALLTALDSANPRELSPARENAAPELVREKVPEVRSNWLTKIGAWFVGIPAAIGAAADGVLGNLDVATGFIQPVKDMLWEVPGWVWLGLIAAVALALYLNARHGEQKGVEAFQTGERR